MSVVFKAIFGCVMAATVVGLDYHIHDNKSAVLRQSGVVTPASYLDSVRQRIGSATTRAPADPLDLAGYLPPAPEGWTRAPYRSSDGETVTGRPYRASMTSVDTTNDLLGGFEKRRRNSGFIVDTYAAGDLRVIVEVAFTDQMTADIPPTVKASGPGTDPAIFGAVKGVVVRQWAQTSRDSTTGTETAVEYRRFNADIGTVHLFVLTNAADAEVQAIFAGIDMPGLAAKAGLTKEMVNTDHPVVWGAAAVPEAEPVGVQSPVAPEAPPPAPAALVIGQDRGLTDGQPPAKLSSGICVRRAGTLLCD